MRRRGSSATGARARKLQPPATSPDAACPRHVRSRAQTAPDSLQSICRARPSSHATSTSSGKIAENAPHVGHRCESVARQALPLSGERRARRHGCDRCSGQSGIDQLTGLQALGVGQTLRAVARDDVGRRRAHIDQQRLRLPVGDQTGGGQKVCGRNRKRIADCRIDGCETFEAHANTRMLPCRRSCTFCRMATTPAWRLSKISVNSAVIVTA